MIKNFKKYFAERIAEIETLNGGEQVTDALNDLDDQTNFTPLIDAETTSILCDYIDKLRNIHCELCGDRIVNFVEVNRKRKELIKEINDFCTAEFEKYYQVIRFDDHPCFCQYLTARGTFSENEIDSFLFAGISDAWTTMNLLYSISKEYEFGRWRFDIKTVTVVKEDQK